MSTWVTEQLDGTPLAHHLEHEGKEAHYQRLVHVLALDMVLCGKLPLTLMRYLNKGCTRWTHGSLAGIHRLLYVGYLVRVCVVRPSVFGYD